MNFKIKNHLMLIILIGMVLLGGCSAPVIHRQLSPDLTGNNDPTVILSRIPQDNVTIYFKNKNYTYTPGGGILWGLIDVGINKSRKSSAEKTINPLIGCTSNIDFRKLYWDELEKAIDDSPWLKVERLDKRNQGYSNEEVKNIKTPFLILFSTYQISTNAKILVVQTKANFYLTSLDKPDYFGYHTYYSEKIGEDSDKGEKAIQLWAADDAGIYREKMIEGIKENMAMLNLDFFEKPADLNQETGEEMSIRIRSFSGTMLNIKGKVLMRNDERICMREKGGNLFSIPLSLAE